MIDARGYLCNLTRFGRCSSYSTFTRRTPSSEWRMGDGMKYERILGIDCYVASHRHHMAVQTCHDESKQKSTLSKPSRSIGSLTRARRRGGGSRPESDVCCWFDGTSAQTIYLFCWIRVILGSFSSLHPSSMKRVVSSSVYWKIHRVKRSTARRESPYRAQSCCCWRAREREEQRTSLLSVHRLWCVSLRSSLTGRWRSNDRRSLWTKINLVRELLEDDDIPIVSSPTCAIPPDEMVGHRGTCQESFRYSILREDQGVESPTIDSCSQTWWWLEIAIY